MTTVLKTIPSLFDDVIDIIGKGEETGTWPLMSSPIYILFIIAAYVYFCLRLGQQFMKNRQPYSLEKVMIYYNVLQIVMNAYLCSKATGAIYERNYKFLSSKIDLSPEVLHYIYLYFLNKLLDLFDTVFMVLRKKNSQITFLHVYHHALMPMVAYLAFVHLGAAISVFFGAVNTFVHVVMYSYYLLTALRPEFRNSIWWKSKLTQLQLAQFVIVILHSMINLFNPESHVPTPILLGLIPQGFIVLFLFVDFYKKTYTKRKTATN